MFFFEAGACHQKIPLRGSESFPNLATVRALAISGDALRRGPAGAEGGEGEVARAEAGAPSLRPTPFGRRGPVQCKARAPPQGHGVGFRFSGPTLKKS